MLKRNKDKDLHTKEWTANRIWGLMGLLLFEIFCVVWLILTEQQLIASILFMACAVGSMVGIVKLAKNYKRKNFKTLIEKDIEEDQKYAEQCGDAYYMWKAYTLPNIVAKGTKNVKMQLDDKDKVILERGKRIALLERAYELVCKEHSKLYCEHYCHKEPCGQCENGDYMFFRDNFLEIAKEKKSEKS